MITHGRIITLQYEDVKGEQVIFSCLDSSIVRQSKAELRFLELYNAHVKVYSILSKSEQKVILVCYFFMLNKYITSIFRIKTFYTIAENEREYYRYIVLAFLKNLVLTQDVVITEKKYERVMFA